jgi:hypothetical protein
MSRSDNCATREDWSAGYGNYVGMSAREMLGEYL